MPRPAEGATNSKGGSKAATERLMSELKAIMKSDPEKQGYRWVFAYSSGDFWFLFYLTVSNP